MINNPYQRYAEVNLLSATPVNLVVALYQHAYDNVSAADRFNCAGDPINRGNAVNKALDALVELTCSLDESTEIAAQLRRLYDYMENRLLEAHFEQSSTKLQEVASLLSTLLSAWREVATQQDAAPSYSEPAELASPVVLGSSPAPAAAAYGRF